MKFLNNKFDFYFMIRIIAIFAIALLSSEINHACIVKPINTCKSENYGNWIYKTIEFYDTLTILKGHFIAKAPCWISSDRNEYLEIDGKRYYVIEDDLPYAIDNKIFEPNDSIDFTYYFPPIRNTVGLHNVNNSNFTLPVFFTPNWSNRISPAQLEEFYTFKVHKSIMEGKVLTALRFIEELYEISNDKIKISNLLNYCNLKSSDNTEQILTILKKAELLWKIDNIVEYQKILSNLEKSKQTLDIISTTNHIKILHDVLSKDSIYNLTDEFIISAIELLEQNKEFDKAKELLSKFDNRMIKNSESIMPQLIMHHAFLRSVCADSISYSEMNNEILNKIPNHSTDYYNFMFNKLNNIGKIEHAVQYGELIISTISIDSLAKNLDIIYKLADCYHRLKQYDKALTIYQLFENTSKKSVKIKDKLDKELLDKRRQCLIRLLHYSDYSSAVIASELNKSLIFDSYGADSYEYAQNLYHAATAYLGIGNETKAKLYYYDAYEFFKRNHPHSQFMINTLYYLAMIEDDDSKVQNLIEEGLQLSRITDNQRHALKFIRLKITASLENGDYDTVYLYMEEAQRIINTKNEAYDEMFMYSYQGDLFYNLNILDKSLEMYTEAYNRILDRNISFESDVYINCISNILSVCFLKNESASILYENSSRLWASLRSVVLTGIKKLPKNERYKLVNLYDSNFNLLQDCLLKANTAESLSLLYDIILFRKGLLLSSDLFYKQKLSLLPGINENDDEFTILQTLEAYGIDYEETLIHWDDVRNIIRPFDLAVEFLVSSYRGTDEEYYALVVSSSLDQPISIRLGNLSELSSKDIDIYNSNYFFDQIWQPILQRFNNIERIYFSPDGEIHNNAIENFYKPERYIKDQKIEFIRVSSTRYLLSCLDQEAEDSYILYGGLYYDSLNQKITDEDNSISGNIVETMRGIDFLKNGVKYLPESKREIDNIVLEIEKYPKMTYQIFQGEDGTESSFRCLQEIKINTLHIATHGFYIPNNKHIISKNRQIDKKLNKFDFEDELLVNNGLFLSLANNAILSNADIQEDTDGILTAKEISRLDLSQIDFVVLSACNTGLGIIKADGVFGLQRGFKIAGINTLLMSLWQVDDEATQILMTAFYKNYLSGKSKRDALLIAQNTVRETPGFRDPEYWASFILLDALN